MPASGASIADVARLWFATAFEGALRPATELLDGVACRVLDLEARSTKSPYAGAILWLGAADGLPRKATLNLASGRPAKEVRFTAYGRRGGAVVLERMEIAHLLPSERGLRTTLEFLSHESRTLDPGMFEPAGARALP